MASATTKGMIICWVLGEQILSTGSIEGFAWGTPDNGMLFVASWFAKSACNTWHCCYLECTSMAFFGMSCRTKHADEQIAEGCRHAYLARACSVVAQRAAPYNAEQLQNGTTSVGEQGPTSRPALASVPIPPHLANTASGMAADVSAALTHQAAASAAPVAGHLQAMHAAGGVHAMPHPHAPNAASGFARPGNMYSASHHYAHMHVMPSMPVINVNLGGFCPPPGWGPVGSPQVGMMGGMPTAGQWTHHHAGSQVR